MNLVFHEKLIGKVGRGFEEVMHAERGERVSKFEIKIDSSEELALILLILASKTIIL